MGWEPPKSFFAKFRLGSKARSHRFGPVPDDTRVFVCPHFSRRKDATLEEWEQVMRQLPEFLPQEQEDALAQVP